MANFHTVAVHARPLIVPSSCWGFIFLKGSSYNEGPEAAGFYGIVRSRVLRTSRRTPFSLSGTQSGSIFPLTSGELQISSPLSHLLAKLYCTVLICAGWDESSFTCLRYVCNRHILTVLSTELYKSATPKPPALFFYGHSALEKHWLDAPRRL